LVIVDTCQSGVADGRRNPYTLLKRSASTQIAVWSAARGDQDSYESPDEPHGLFTHALLQAIRAREDRLAVLEDLQVDVSARVAAGVERLRASLRRGEESLQAPPDSARGATRVGVSMDPALRIQQTPELSSPQHLRRMVIAGGSTLTRGVEQ
jgi:hypothetical protein